MMNQSGPSIHHSSSIGFRKRAGKPAALCLSAALLLMAALLLLSACGGATAPQSPGAAAPSGGGSTGSGSTAAYDSGGYAGSAAPEVSQSQPGYASSSANGYTAGEGKVASEENAALADRKIIRNANLEIMAQDAAALYRDIVAYGTSLGGYESSYNISNFETYSVIRAEYKIPPESLGLFVDFIGENGEIVNSNMSSQDITESYYDTRTRMETKRKSLERYYQLLNTARGVEEIVYIQRIIDGITEDIESLEGRLNLWNSQVDMSTVSLYIRQENDPLQIRKEISWNTLSMDDMGYLIKRGFYSVTNTIFSLLQWLAVILVGYSPIWIIAAAGFVVWRIVRKRRREKNQADPAAKTRSDSTNSPDNERLSR